MQSSQSGTVKPARAEFWAGWRAITPLVIGAVPFGIIFGTLAASSGLSFWGTIAIAILPEI